MKDRRPIISSMVGGHFLKTLIYVLKMGERPFKWLYSRIIFTCAKGGHKVSIFTIATLFLIVCIPFLSRTLYKVKADSFLVFLSVLQHRNTQLFRPTITSPQTLLSYLGWLVSNSFSQTKTANCH